ncbi:transcription antitermination factor NusB [Terriglobus aquaticus]|uniref:Transcription antitermination factor NusB n=1 Tax=Terriglobus aquaticus TaxID=940139 RepID=A0ABW9KRC8_9BACT|nr:transcription antitermination factor NusB [Terriglobus aquaticus]
MHAPARPLGRPITIAPAREAAFTILQRVMNSAAHSDDLLHAPAVDALSAADRNLTTALVLGVLRWQIALDAAIRPLLQRPEADLHPAALLALRLGMFQLRHMDRIPAHAAISESVELARTHDAPHAAGMVNAVLRRMTREPAAPRATLAAETPAEIAHPRWLLQRWRKHFGGKVARALAAYDQAEPPAHGLFAEDTALPTIDDGSRLVAELAAAAHPAPQRILDACAAPGGKTAVLAIRHPNADIVAVDVSEKRLARMRSRMDVEPSTARVRTVLADMSLHPNRTSDVVGGEADREALAGSFDLILCDAPCSGTGTLARNPEIRHRLQERDLSRQAERQAAILRNALTRLAPGGRLVYSTCSLEPEENEAVIQTALGSGIRLLPAADVLANLPGLSDTAHASLQDALTAEGSVRTVPGQQPCDGFYAAILER